ncbi:MAG: PAS domain S-box protein [Melioribacteraceae bacterium]|nr:MAG: PAS domain S-box protein [Melioribacteraceae bacterium]
MPESSSGKTGNKSFSLSELLNKYDNLSKEVEQLKSSFLNKSKLDAFFTLAPIPLISIDINCAILFANKAFLNLISEEVQNVLGKKIKDFVIDNNKLEDIQTNIKKLFTGELDSYKEKLEFRSKTKSKIILEIQARLVEYDDEIKKAVHITFQDRSEEEKFKEAYKNVVENSLQAILIIQDFKIVFANQRAAEISGYSINELTKLDINGVKHLVHPEDRERMFEVMKLRFSGKRVSPKQEFRGIRKNGQVYWIEVLASFMNYNGKPALQVVQLDISDKKKVESEITKVESKYITLVEQSIIGVYIITDNVFTYVNPKLAEIFGYDQDEMTNKLTPKDLIHPNDRDLVLSNIEKRISGEVNSLHYEFRGIRKNGREITVEVHGSRSEPDGKISIIGMLQDITERKDIENQLYLQSTALSSAANGIVITDSKGTIVYINPAVTKLTGYTFDELIGKKPNIFKSGKHDKLFYKNIWDKINSGNVWEGEITNKKKDGTDYIERQTITPVRGKDARIEYFIAIKNDVTESKNIENALRESEEKLRNVIEHSNEMYYIHDTNHVLKYVSPQSYEMLGYTEDELMINWTQLASDNPINKTAFELTEKAIKTGERQDEYLLELIRKDGKKIFVQTAESPILDESGRVTAIAGALRNVTEKIIAENKLKESEERFRGLYENAILGIYRTSPQGEIVMANPALCKLLGYDSFEDFKKIPASEALYEKSSTRKIFKELMDERSEVYGFETIAKKKDGTNFFIRESARAVKDENGNVQYYEGIIEDITTQKNIEEKLIEAKDNAEQSDKLKSEFLAQMSHEIRTPINVILSFSNLIKEEVRGFISDDLYNSFSIVDGASRRIIRTIDLILNMSQLQTGSYQATMNDFDLYQTVFIQLYPEFSRLAKEKKLELEINNRIESTEIYADEFSVRQIFENLIHNAIKYTHKGRITIEIFKNENENIVVEIRDTGIGISKEYLPKVFTPFTQEEHGYTRKYEGNGLGLALVKRYCELNKIQISVDSEKHVGTTFTLIFPLKEN